MAFIAGGMSILIIYRIVGRQRPGPVTRGFRLGQVISASLLALSHGMNDAQKTMGIIFLALVANGNMSADADIPTWVIVSSASAISLGTYFGGWRIVNTMGSKIIKMDPAQGFAAQGAGASLAIVPLNFTNKGTISVTDETVTIGYDVGGVHGSWSNAGLIALSGTATLILDGSLTTAGLGTITGASGVTVAGILNNTGTTLNVGHGTQLGLVNLANGGLINGGTIIDHGAGFSFDRRARGSRAG